MSAQNQLENRLKEQGGLLRTSQAMEYLSKPAFYQFAKRNHLERVAPGMYASRDAWIDTMYLLHLRFSQLIFSHETALYFHDLTDRDPLFYTVTVQTGYNPTLLKKEGLQVFTIQKELHSLGAATCLTPFGHRVPVYDTERTLCDILRSRSKMEPQTIQTAWKRYLSGKKKDLHLLLHYAGVFHVEKMVRQYLEVLL